MAPSSPARFLGGLRSTVEPSSTALVPITDAGLFSDRGAWHAYGLPRGDEPGQYGAPTGPLCIVAEQPCFLSPQLSRLTVSETRGFQLFPGPCVSVDHLREPSHLRLSYELRGLRIDVRIFFVSDRSALIRTTLVNLSGHKRELRCNWTGTLFDPSARLSFDLQASPRGPVVVISGTDEPRHFSIQEASFVITHELPVLTRVQDGSFEARLGSELLLEPGERKDLWRVESFTLTPSERDRERDVVTEILEDPTRTLNDATARWEGYVARAVEGVPQTSAPLAVKAIETLVANWRSPAGKIRSSTTVPSIAYPAFAVGSWSWDNWKAAVGISHFDPGLAEAAIRSTFDHQVSPASTRPHDAGMVPDVVSYAAPEDGGREWNERNSKPPLAAWATWCVYLRGRSRPFLEELFPKLLRFHDWWYTNRSHNGNGLAEYGATYHPLNSTPEERRQAAAWESGMDNAPRFDAARVVANRGPDGGIVGYSLGQHSVDLNCYLYADKLYLALIGAEIGNTVAAERLRSEASQVAMFVQGNMWDPETGYFYDCDIGTGALCKLYGKGIEGALPLWAGLATKEQAAAVQKALCNPQEFGTPVPFPTVSSASPYFDPQGYWRGPTWLDHSLLVLAGLCRYGYTADARRLVENLLANAEGLRSDAPIAENYDPISGAAQGARNFSWSAAVALCLVSGHVEDLLREEICPPDLAAI